MSGLAKDARTFLAMITQAELNELDVEKSDKAASGYMGVIQVKGGMRGSPSVGGRCTCLGSIVSPFKLRRCVHISFSMMLCCHLRPNGRSVALPIITLCKEVACIQSCKS